MALTRLASVETITADGQVIFYVVTNEKVFLQWENSLGDWITMRNFDRKESFALSMETGVNWRFKFFDTDSYIEYFA
tara:strand:+ start:227 stop:457 length:231 start_codon:yes stop_codon:yes gene_type:complete